jgi:mono/diheme cytochrome c family protein
MRIVPLALLLCLWLAAGLAQGQGQESLFQQGQDIFRDNCAQCHRLNGEGLPGTFPALKGNKFVTGDQKPVIVTVLNGRKGQWGQMPTWKHKLTDEQIAAAVTYIRHAWTNQAGPVTPAQVAAVRAESK